MSGGAYEAVLAIGLGFIGLTFWLYDRHYNRDDAIFDRPNEFRIDRENARQHLAFGIGVHFCMGSRLAEMQLRVLWEETLARFREVEVVGEPVRVRSPFVKGYTHIPVQLHPW